jgi:hypothetical protein
MDDYLGFETVEMFIQGLHNEFLLVDEMKGTFYMLVSKPWEERPYEEDEEAFKYTSKKREEFKFLRYDKPERE